jgi:hypothetical protein
MTKNIFEYHFGAGQGGSSWPSATRYHLWRSPIAIHKIYNHLPTLGLYLKQFVLFSSLLFVSNVVRSQSNSQLKEIKVLSDSTHDFAVDNLGNIYLVNASQQVKKLNNNYDSVGVFNNVRRYGKLDYIDAANPLKVLLFYKDFGTIVILDRFLNTRSAIDVRKSDILQCGAIAQSYDNNIWVYDELESKIKKLDDNGTVLLESPDFRIVFDDPPRLDKLEDYNKYVYGYDSSKGLLVMDYFGAYRNLVAFKGWKNVHGISKGIVATDATGLVYYQPGNINTQHLSLPAAILQSKKIRINGSLLYALQNDGRLHIYQLSDF